MRTPVPTLLILLLCWAATGCDRSDAYCLAVEVAASEHVGSALAGDQPCASDDDCEVVAVSGSCFDSCHAVIARANRDIFEQALDQAEADHCSDYEGCTLIIPPCAPPPTAVCGTDGQCGGG